MLPHGSSPAAPDTVLVAIDTEWVTHREHSQATEREVTDCDGTLTVARRTPVGRDVSVLEIECTGCLFECTTDDLSFRRAQERRGDDVGDDWRWWQR